MRVTDIKQGDYFTDGETQSKVVVIFNNEATVRIKGPDVNKVVRGQVSEIIKMLNFMYSVPLDYESYDEYNADVDRDIKAKYQLVACAPDDIDFDATQSYYKAFLVDDEYDMKYDAKEI